MADSFEKCGFTTKYLEKPCSCHFSGLNDHLTFQAEICTLLPFSEMISCTVLEQAGQQLDYKTAAAAVRSLQTEMHLHRNAAKITQKEGEKKNGKGSIAPFGGKSATITGSNVSGSKWPPHILQFAVSMVPVLVRTKVVLSLNTTLHRSHNRVRCSLPQKGSSAKVKSGSKKKISLSPQ